MPRNLAICRSLLCSLLFASVVRDINGQWLRSDTECYGTESTPLCQSGTIEISTSNANAYITQICLNHGGDMDEINAIESVHWSDGSSYDTVMGDTNKAGSTSECTTSLGIGECIDSVWVSYGARLDELQLYTNFGAAIPSSYTYGGGGSTKLVAQGDANTCLSKLKVRPGTSGRNGLSIKQIALYFEITALSTTAPSTPTSTPSNAPSTTAPTLSPTKAPTTDLTTTSPTALPTLSTSNAPTISPSSSTPTMTNIPNGEEYGIETTIKLDGVLPDDETEELIDALYEHAQQTANSTDCNERIDILSQVEDDKTVIEVSIATCSEAIERVFLVAFSDTVLEYDIINVIVSERRVEEIEVEGIYDEKIKSANAESASKKGGGGGDWFAFVLMALIVFLSAAVIRKCYVERKKTKRLDRIQNENTRGGGGGGGRGIASRDMVLSTSRGDDYDPTLEPGATLVDVDDPLSLMENPGAAAVSGTTGEALGDGESSQSQSQIDRDDECEEKECSMDARQETEMAPVVTAGGYPQEENIAADEFVIEDGDDDDELEAHGVAHSGDMTATPGMVGTLGAGDLDEAQDAAVVIAEASADEDAAKNWHE